MTLRHRQHERRGFTLVELLVVVGIIVVLLAVSIPALKIVTQEGKTREAARTVNAIFVVAQARAAETGRAVGVWIERNPNDPNQAFTLFMAEVPPPYMGDFTGAGAVINADPGADLEWGTLSGGSLSNGDDDNNGNINDPSERDPGGTRFASDDIGFKTGPDNGWGRASYDDDGDGVPDDPSNLTIETDEAGWPGSDDNYATFSTTGWPVAASFPNLVLVGDRIRFDQKGPLYRIDQVISGPPVQARFSHPSAPPPSNLGMGVTYEIFRQPIKSSVGSVELPRGTIIDLDLSGFGATLFENAFQSFDVNGDGTSDSGPIIIMLRPNGSVDQVYYSVPNPLPPAAPTSLAFGGVRLTTPLHLLIGRDDEGIDGNPTNLENETSLWVSIGRDTGSVTSSENGVVPAAGSINQKIAAARSLARQAQTMKGG